MDKREDTVEPNSPIDNIISRLDDEVKATKKLVNGLIERLASIVTAPTCPPEDKNQPKTACYGCSLGGRIDGIQDIAEESNRLLADITGRLQI